MIKVLIQTARGSAERRIYDERTLEYKETRAGDIPYLHPYGFIPGTHSADGACVDCYVLTRDSLEVGSIVECEPLGLLEQDEGGEVDHKVLAGLPGQIGELDQTLLEELRTFIHSLFAKYPHMTVTVGDLLPSERALQFIAQHREINGIRLDD